MPAPARVGSAETSKCPELCVHENHASHDRLTNRFCAQSKRIFGKSSLVKTRCVCARNCGCVEPGNARCLLAVGDVFFESARRIALKRCLLVANSDNAMSGLYNHYFSSVGYRVETVSDGLACLESDPTGSSGHAASRPATPLGWRRGCAGVPSGRERPGSHSGDLVRRRASDSGAFPIAGSAGDSLPRKTLLGDHPAVLCRLGDGVPPGAPCQVLGIADSGSAASPVWRGICGIFF